MAKVDKLAQIATKTTLVIPAVLCADHAKKHRPRRKSDIESWRSNGRTEMSASTLHWMKPVNLKKMMRRRARGDVYSVERNSRSHWLASMLNDAVVRLRIKLADHKTFARFMERGGGGFSQVEVAMQARMVGSKERLADELR